MGATDADVRRAERLGDRVNGRPEHVDEVVPQLLEMLRTDSAPGVLEAVIEGLGHAWTEDASLAVGALADHPDDSVRLAVARTLPCGVDSPQGMQRAASALCKLAHDKCDDVRDWAMFGLGSQLDADTAEIRDALGRGLADPHIDVRMEALVGLAVRGDDRALEAARRALTGEVVARLAVDAARSLADASLLAELIPLTEWWDVDPELLMEAIEACRQAGRISPGGAVGTNSGDMS